MADKEAPKGRSVGREVTQPMAEFMATMQTAGLSHLRWLGADWHERLTDASAELAAFAAERIREDVKTQHALMHCKSLPEAQAIQAEFVRRMVEQYAAGTGKLLEIQAKLFAEPEAGDATKPSGRG